MLTEAIAEIMERDIQKLKNEIELYEDESKLWVIDKEIKNCAGNLALHLCGNLRHFIGHILGRTDYKRNREEEFSLKNLAKSKLISEIEAALADVKNTLKSLNDKDLEKAYPVEVFKKEYSTGFFLTHLCAHLNYHLGQINYHRRLLG
jgi:uncharacterized damage-inducible protein DinB